MLGGQARICIQVPIVELHASAHIRRKSPYLTALKTRPITLAFSIGSCKSLTWCFPVRRDWTDWNGVNVELSCDLALGAWTEGELSELAAAEMARKCHSPARGLALICFLSSTWGRADQRTSHDSNESGAFCFAANLGPGGAKSI